MPARADSVSMAQGQEEESCLPIQSSLGGKWHSGRGIRHWESAWLMGKAEVVALEELGACLQAGEMQPFLPSGSRPFPKGSVCDIF